MEASSSYTAKTSKKAQVWTNEHNDVLIKEMYLFEPWQYKKGSKQRGQVWEEISHSLNDSENPQFHVNQKSVRDHYNFLEKENKKRIRDEEKASGISPDHTAAEIDMEDIIERFKARDEDDKQEDNNKKEEANTETAKAVEMRKSSMETLAQTKKRKCDEGPPRKKRSTTSTDTIVYLQEKAELDAKLKREELQLRKLELENQQKQQELLLQQMQMQNVALMSLIQNIKK